MSNKHFSNSLHCPYCLFDAYSQVLNHFVLLGNLFILIFCALIFLKNRNGTGAIIAFKFLQVWKTFTGKCCWVGHMFYSCQTGHGKMEIWTQTWKFLPPPSPIFPFLFLDQLASPKAFRRRPARQGQMLPQSVFLSCSAKFLGCILLPQAAFSAHSLLLFWVTAKQSGKLILKNTLTDGPVSACL
jgi:hypothetical protein